MTNKLMILKFKEDFYALLGSLSVCELVSNRNLAVAAERVTALLLKDS